MNFYSQRFSVTVRTLRNCFISRQILKVRIRFGHYLHGKEIIRSYDCTALNSYKSTSYENAFLEGIGQMPFLFKVSSLALSWLLFLPQEAALPRSCSLLSAALGSLGWDLNFCRWDNVSSFLSPFIFLVSGFFFNRNSAFGPVLNIYWKCLSFRSFASGLLEDTGLALGWFFLFAAFRKPKMFKCTHLTGFAMRSLLQTFCTSHTAQ